MLTEKQALQIFEIKLSMQSKLSHTRLPSVVPRFDRNLIRGMSGPVSKLFGISSRAVRDVWNRKTWGYATKELWHQDRFSQTLAGDSSGSAFPSFQVRLLAHRFGIFSDTSFGYSPTEESTSNHGARFRMNLQRQRHFSWTSHPAPPTLCSSASCPSPLRIRPCGPIPSIPTGATGESKLDYRLIAANPY
jgi:hypothetical protein